MDDKARLIRLDKGESSSELPMSAKRKCADNMRCGGDEDSKKSKRADDAGQNGKPKRPMSAYNFFFRDERTRILKEAESSQESAEQQDASGKKASRRRPHGIVSFRELGRIVSEKWKNVDPSIALKYKTMAKNDSERYRRELDEYYKKQDAELNALATKQNEAAELAYSRSQEPETSMIMQREAASAPLQSVLGVGGDSVGAKGKDCSGMDSVDVESVRALQQQIGAYPQQDVLSVLHHPHGHSMNTATQEEMRSVHGIPEWYGNVAGSDEGAFRVPAANSARMDDNAGAFRVPVSHPAARSSARIDHNPDMLSSIETQARSLAASGMESSAAVTAHGNQLSEAALRDDALLSAAQNAAEQARSDHTKSPGEKLFPTRSSLVAYLAKATLAAERDAATFTDYHRYRNQPTLSVLHHPHARTMNVVTWKELSGVHGFHEPRALSAVEGLQRQQVVQDMAANRRINVIPPMVDVNAMAYNPALNRSFAVGDQSGTMKHPMFERDSSEMMAEQQVNCLRQGVVNSGDKEKGDIRQDGLQGMVAMDSNSQLRAHRNLGLATFDPRMDMSMAAPGRSFQSHPGLSHDGQMFSGISQGVSDARLFQSMTSVDPSLRDFIQKSSAEENGQKQFFFPR